MLTEYGWLSWFNAIIGGVQGFLYERVKLLKLIIVQVERVGIVLLQKLV